MYDKLAIDSGDGDWHVGIYASPDNFVVFLSQSQVQQITDY